MAFEDLANTRDSGAAVRRYVFRYGPNPTDIFAYTDAPRDHVLPGNGRQRVYITIDRSAGMTPLRFHWAREAIRNALLDIRAKIVDDPVANVFDLAMNRFSNASSQIVRFSATPAHVDEIIGWLDALTTDGAAANFVAGVTQPATWFAGAGDFAKYRSWIFVTSGICDEATIPAAQEIVAPLVNFVGSADVGFNPTDIYPVLVGSADGRNVRFLQNTPHLPVVTVQSAASPAITNRVNTVLRSDFTFQSIPIQMDPMKVNGSPGDKNEVRITVAKNTSIAEYYRTQRIQKAMNLTVYEGQADDPDQEFRVIWSGRVLSAKRMIKANAVELTVHPVTSAFQRNGLRRKFQYGCPHALYGDLCKASQAAATVSFAPTLLSWSPTSRVLAVPTGFLGATPQVYAGGLVTWQSAPGVVVRRNIIRVGTDTLQLDGPIEQAHDAATIFVAKGCAHTREFCAAEHIDSVDGGSNILNFGGQDQIPVKDPFRFVSNYY